MTKILEHPKYKIESKPVEAPLKMKMSADAVIPTFLSDSWMWGLAKINVKTAWAENQGEGIVIAVLDTGVNKNHETLLGKVIDGKNFTTDYASDTTNYSDNQGHGTHVCGTIVGATQYNQAIGVAPKAKLIVGKISGSVYNPVYDTTSYGATAEWLAAGINWAINWRGPNGEKVKIINLSFQTSSNPLLLLAYKNAIEAGIIFVAAAGNSGDGNVDTLEYFYLQSQPECVTIANMDTTELSQSSSNMNSAVDFMAPGTSIYSAYHKTNNQYINLSGTSMASPHMAGIMAIICSTYEKAGQFLSATAAVKIVKEYTRKNNNLLYAQQGNGLVDFAIKQLPKPNTLFPLDSDREFLKVILDEAHTSFFGLNPLNIWERNRGENVVVAVLSTGAEKTHEALTNQILDGKNFTTENSGKESDYADTNGMGTLCAGLIAGKQKSWGLAPHSKLIVGKIQNVDLTYNVDSILNGIEWVKNWRGNNGEKANVLLTTFFYKETDTAIFSRHKEIKTALEELTKHYGITVVSGSGDSGDSSKSTIDEIVYPGYLKSPTVISVGGIKTSMGYFGLKDTFYSKSAINTNVDLAAPSDNISGIWLNNAVPNTSRSSTAYGAAYTVGAIAIIISVYRKNGILLNNSSDVWAELQKFLRATYNHNKRQYGYGVLDLSWGQWPEPIPEEIHYVFEKQ